MVANATRSGSVDSIPLPIRLRNGSYEVAMYDLHGMKALELRTLVKIHGLKSTASNKAAWSEALRAYSVDTAEWGKNTAVTARTPHKGPRKRGNNTGRTPAANKCTVHSNRSSGTILSWAKQAVDVAENIRATAMSTDPPPSGYLTSPRQNGYLDQTSNCTPYNTRQQTEIQTARTEKSSTTHQTALLPTRNIGLVSPMIDCEGEGEQEATAATALVSPKTPLVSDSTERLLILNLAHMTLSYSTDDIPIPPNKKFANNIPQLAAMWDDASPQWDNASPLLIRATPIAVKYWPQVYKYVRPSQWTRIKQRWHQYENLMEEYLAADEQVFWRNYTRHGKHMTWSQVLQAIKEKRADKSLKIAAHAKISYGDKFEELFRYKCSRTRTWAVMTNAHAIAQQYRRLKQEGL